jgi:hypothetical protein
MKHSSKTFRTLVLVSLCWFNSTVFGYFPEPGNIYYGIVRDTDGRQMNAADGVRLLMQTSRTNIVAGRPQVDTFTVAECELVTSSVGQPNFMLRPSLDGGGQNRYSPLALRIGEQVRVLLVRNGLTNELIGAVAPPSARGAFQPTSLTAQCADVDHDGLCDQWELDNFGTLEFTDGTTDFDGDGRTEKQEHDEGTSPLNPNDPPSVPLVLKVIYANASVITVEWRRLPGHTYGLQSSSGLGAGFVPVPPADLIGDPDSAGTVQVKSNDRDHLFLRVVEE